MVIDLQRVPRPVYVSRLSVNGSSTTRRILADGEQAVGIEDDDVYPSFVLI